MAYSSPPHQLSRSVPSALASSSQNPGIIGEPSRSRHLASSSEKPPPRNGEFLLQLLQQGGAISNQPSLKNSCLVVESALDNERSAWHIQDPAVAALGPSHPAQLLGDAGTEGNQISAQHLFGWRPPSAISSDFPFPSPVDLSIFLDGSLPSSTDPLFHPHCNHPVKAPADQYPPRQHPFVQFPSSLHSSADLSVLPFVDHSSDSSRSTYGPGTSQHLASPMFSLPTGIPSSQRRLEVTCHPSVSRQGLPGEVGVLPACESGLSNSIRQVLLPHSSFHIHRLEISEGLDFELPTFSNAVLAFNEIQTKESGLAGGELKGPHHGAIGVLKGDECASKTNPGDNVSQLWTSTCPGTQFEEGKPLVSRPGVRYEEVATDSTSRPRFRHLEVSTDSIRRPISCHNEACRVEKSHRFQSGDGHDRAVVEPWLNEWGSTNVELPVHFQESRDKTVLLPRKDTETCDIERGIANLDMCGRSEDGKKFSTLAVEVLAANDMDFIGVNDKELKLEVTRESARHNGIKGDWGYGPPHVESFKKGSIRTATGQWVAVVREREAADATMKELVEGDGKLEFSGVSYVGHPETFSLSHDRLIHKTHDDPKKKKGQMQEWRMKQSQATDRLPRPHNDTALNTRSLRSNMNSSQHSSEDKCDFPESCFPSQLDHPGLASTSNLDSAQGIAKEQSKQVLQAFTHTVKDEKARARAERGKSGLYQDCVNEPKGCGQDFKKEEAEDMIRGLGGSLEFNTNDIEVSSASGCKPGMSDTVKTMRDSLRRVGRPLQQAVTRLHRRQLLNRPDLEKLTKEFLGVFQSLIPPEDEEVRRKQLISGLEELISESWPGAKLFLFGSCANAFGVCNSDIDVCLSLQGEHSSKPELVLRLAEILQGDKMLNVQALTHARVPIVKFTDPTTGISCDICINNMLAVVNTKLLYDYAQIDSRLRQLAFMVKHWAKRRQVNETYRGTLSSYAYVLMCIHFLQQRRPAILPCLQEMEPTYKVTVGKIQCSYYDQVHRLKNFGAKNKETIGELLTSFFEYWAFRHDYSHAVISVRTGGFLSKIEKDWTRRIGNERHLICIEDPFEISHDLGRVVDKHSIGVLREEFQRAAKIMRHDSNPSETLFELYVREEA